MLTENREYKDQHVLVEGEYQFCVFDGCTLEIVGDGVDIHHCEIHMYDVPAGMSEEDTEQWWIDNLFVDSEEDGEVTVRDCEIYLNLTGFCCDVSDSYSRTPMIPIDPNDFPPTFSNIMLFDDKLTGDFFNGL